MSFRRMSGIRLPYRRQGLIYFTLLSYEDMGKRAKTDRRQAARGGLRRGGLCRCTAGLVLRQNDGAGGGDRARRQREHALPGAQAAV